MSHYLDELLDHMDSGSRAVLRRALGPDGTSACPSSAAILHALVCSLPLSLARWIPRLRERLAEEILADLAPLMAEDRDTEPADSEARTLAVLERAVELASARDSEECRVRPVDLLAALLIDPSPAMVAWFAAYPVDEARIAHDVGVTGLRSIRNGVSSTVDRAVEPCLGRTPLELDSLRQIFDAADVVNAASDGRRGSRSPHPSAATVGDIALRVERHVRAEIDSVVIGQEHAKRVLVAAGLQHLLRLDGRPLAREVVLLVGPTGSGKTLLVETLARALRVVLVRENAPDFTRAGYVGRSVGDIAGDVAAAAEGDDDLARRAIIFIDEIDKLALPSDSSRLEVGWRSVQQALLNLLEGGVIESSEWHTGNTARADLSSNLVVLAGAFEGLDRLIAERAARVERCTGFGAAAERSNRAIAPCGTTPAPSVPTAEDLIEYGLIPELVGRVTSIAPLCRLEPREMIAILSRSRRSALLEAQEYFRSFGVELELTEDALEAAAAAAWARGTGARALAAILRERLAPLRAALPALAADGVRSVRLDAAAWRGESVPELGREISFAATAGLVSVWRQVEEHLRQR
jgi:ATP-dependent Clp protease ATP-binding subunit ClpX